MADGRRRFRESDSRPTQPKRKPKWDARWKPRGTGRDGPGKEGDQLTKGGNKKSDDEYGAVDDAYDLECAGYFAAGAAYEPPTTDADGFPLDDIA